MAVAKPLEKAEALNMQVFNPALIQIKRPAGGGPFKSFSVLGNTELVLIKPSSAEFGNAKSNKK